MKAKLVTGLLIASVIAPAVLSQSASAWHPVGKIKKEVQNVTTGGMLEDANFTSTAVDVKTGDILKYVITVSNEGNLDSRNYNDMTSTKLTDTLPEGVELVANPTQRNIVVELGTIAPKQKIVKEYEVKVVSAENKKSIENKACFTGNSAVNDAPQAGCDVAVIKTNIPQTSSTTTPPPAPTPTPTPVVKAAVKEMPKTGVSGKVIGLGLTATVLGYFVAMRRQTKQTA